MKTIKYVFRIVLAGLLILNIFSCKENLSTNLQLEKNSKTIMVYLRDNPSYSILLEALEITNFADALNLYGTMTFFAPTNAAFEKFLARRGVSKISDIDTEELKKIITYHLYDKVYGSGLFTSGSLGSVTVEGDFIQMDISEGVRKTKLNSSVNVDSIDIPITNGIIHVIDDVLEPPTLNLYEWLKTQPQYTIMVEAFERTGNDTAILSKVVYDPKVLNFGKPSVKWRTVFLEPNSVLAKKGINSFADLAIKYSQTHTYSAAQSYSAPTDSLNLFVRYHAMERKFFASDFRKNYYESFSKGNWLSFSTTPALSINVYMQTATESYNPATTITTYIYTDLPHVTLALDKSNKIARNGIVHCIDSVLTIFTPKPILTVFRFAGEPEDRMINLPDGSRYNIIDVINTWKNDPVKQESVWWLKWWGGIGTVSITSAWPADAFNDYILWVQNNPSDYWVELTTKPIFPGTYKIYTCIRRHNNPNYYVQYYWDDAEMGGVLDINKGGTDEYGNSICGTDCKQYRQIGIKKFTEMAQHKFKLHILSPGANYNVWYSIEIRPI